MDATNCSCFLLIGFLTFLAVHGQQGNQGLGQGCFQELAQNSDFLRCSESFTVIMQEMGKSAPMEPFDETAVYSAFCSPEGKAGLKCLMDFMFECPDIKAAMSMGSQDGQGGGPDFTEIAKQGGVDVFCEMATTNCKAVMENCMEKINSTGLSMMMSSSMTATMPGGLGYSTTTEKGEPDAQKPPTPYTLMPMQMMMVCGPMNDMLTCVLDSMGECPAIAKKFEDTLSQMSDLQRQKGGPELPSYAESKAYIKNECPKLPKDFSSKQQCLMTSLNQTAFNECYNMAQNTKTENCDIYRGGKECVMKYVGGDCGESYAVSIVEASPLFSAEIPGNCEVSGVSNLQASVLAVIGTGILVFLGRF